MNRADPNLQDPNLQSRFKEVVLAYGDGDVVRIIFNSWGSRR